MVNGIHRRCQNSSDGWITKSFGRGAHRSGRLACRPRHLRYPDTAAMLLNVYARAASTGNRYVPPATLIVHDGPMRRVKCACEAKGIYNSLPLSADIPAPVANSTTDVCRDELMSPLPRMKCVRRKVYAYPHV